MWTEKRGMVRGLLMSLALIAALAGPTDAQIPAAPEPSFADTTRTAVSPGGAFIRSLVLPGWGQAYVGSPGRGVVYFAMEAGSAWMAYKSWRQLDEGRAMQSWMREAGRLGPDEKLDIVSSREEQFEDWITLSIFLMLFSGIDAYVTAQLADFDERIGVLPERNGFTVQATVPVGARR